MMLAAALVLAGCDDDDCDTLKSRLDTVVARFSPSSSDSCTADSDCTLVSDAIVRHGNYCRQGCGIPVPVAYGAEYEDYVVNNPDVTSACDAVIAAHCEDKIPVECPCYTPPNKTTCGDPGCKSGTCE